MVICPYVWKYIKYGNGLAILGNFDNCLINSPFSVGPLSHCSAVLSQIFSCNDDKITPSHQASSEGHVQCLKALVEVGAKIDSRDARGHLPIDLAKLWGHRKCARFGNCVECLYSNLIYIIVYYLYIALLLTDFVR